MSRPVATLQPEVDQALEILGIRNFLLGVHDAAFPGTAEEDIGCGTPYSRGAAQFLRFARGLGFNGIQLGPQGITSLTNPSPYDGTFFSREPLLLAALALTREPWPLLRPGTLAELVAQQPSDRSRGHRAIADKAIQRITAEVNDRFRQAGLRHDVPAVAALRQAFAKFRQGNAAWLDRDALYESLRNSYGGQTWSQWAGSAEAKLDRQLFAPQPDNEKLTLLRIRALRQRHAVAIENYCFTQFLIARQHQALQRLCRRMGLSLFGDSQIGMSDRDAWAAQAYLLPGYHLGAPPSRTNSDGQPWNYPLLDPRRYGPEEGRPGPAIRFLQARIDKLFAEFDGLRIDHPHGLICPWVYRADQQDTFHAVQNGARLFASPMLADHGELVQFAIVRPDQLNPGVARYDDAWVARLAPDQVRHYARLFAVIVASARQNRRRPRQIACEILSTQPYPLKCVMEQYGLGRFRVTQKADLSNDDDVYRSENARPEDWLMLGSHDTQTIWQVAEDWFATGTARQQADYLAIRLRIPGAERDRWITRICSDPGLLVQAKFADLFIGPAENVMVYFTDLLGMQQGYNRPGSVNDSNWSLRVDPAYQTLYRFRVAQTRALNIPLALAMALRAQGEASLARHSELITALESAGEH